MTAEHLTSSQFYERLYASDVFKNDTARGELKYKILERAKVFHMKTHVNDQFKALEKRLAKENREKNLEELQKNIKGGITEFLPDKKDQSYRELYCGNWIATDDGIYSQESSRMNQLACYHPIIPVRRLCTMETGEEQITIAYKRAGPNELWGELTVPKDMIASSKTIVGLSKYGISVTSETAKLLVRYLADVENLNNDIITLVRSSSKLGWHGIDFLPYDKEIVFDAELRFPQICKAITEGGNFNVWFEHVKEIRSGKWIEPRIALAASFASVIIEFLGIASPIVDFWGMTEGGKTVQSMLAASVWACPDEGLYMGDFLTTDAELEVRGDLLNNLPLILDDTAKMRKGIKDNIEQVIYNLSSGSGKKRSNKDLGQERVRTWKNVIIVNGERPLNSFADQGGAINRIIEVGLNEERLFEDPQKTAKIVRENYGFAGVMFVRKLQEMLREDKSMKKLRKMHAEYAKELTTSETMQKQVLSMAAILTADNLATEFIFQDGCQLQAQDVSKYLTSKSQVSDGSRCYEYLMNIIAESGQHFDIQFDGIDQWGELETVTIKKQNNDALLDFKKEEDVITARYVNFYSHAFGELLKKEGYSRKAFTSWAKREKLLRWNSGERDHYAVRQPGGLPQKTFISLKMVDLDEYREQMQEDHMFD